MNGMILISPFMQVAVRVAIAVVCLAIGWFARIVFVIVKNKINTLKTQIAP